MIPSVADLKRRTRLPEYSKGEGYASVPLSDWNAVLWMLENMAKWEARLDAAEAVVEAARSYRNARSAAVEKVSQDSIAAMTIKAVELDEALDRYDEATK